MFYNGEKTSMNRAKPHYYPHPNGAMNTPLPPDGAPDFPISGRQRKNVTAETYSIEL